MSKRRKKGPKQRPKSRSEQPAKDNKLDYNAYVQEYHCEVKEIGNDWYEVRHLNERAKKAIERMRPYAERLPSPYRTWGIQFSLALQLGKALGEGPETAANIENVSKRVQGEQIEGEDYAFRFRIPNAKVLRVLYKNGEDYPVEKIVHSSVLIGLMGLDGPERKQAPTPGRHRRGSSQRKRRGKRGSRGRGRLANENHLMQQMPDGRWLTYEEAIAAYSCRVEEINPGSFHVSELNKTARAAVDRLARDASAPPFDKRGWAVRFGVALEVHRILGLSAPDSSASAMIDSRVTTQKIEDEDYAWVINIIDPDALDSLIRTSERTRTPRAALFADSMQVIFLTIDRVAMYTA